ncbi:bestrophin-like domain [Actinokineospora sp. NPDC004072]
MSIYLSGLLWVLGAALVAGLAAYVVRRIGETDGIVENNEAAGQVFTIVGGLHAVLLAFVLISLFDSVGAAENSAFKEADGLVAANWAAEALGQQTREQMRELALSYATRVVDEEWPLMREGADDAGGAGWADLQRMRSLVTAAPVTEQWQNDQKTEAANKLWEVYEARQARLDSAGSGGVSTVLWFALIAGSIMSISLPLLFGGPRPRVHIIIVSVLAGTLALLLFATYQLQNPYGGGAAVAPEAFEAAIARLR